MLELHDREWNEFYLRDIFPDIQRGKRLKMLTIYRERLLMYHLLQ